MNAQTAKAKKLPHRDDQSPYLLKGLNPNGEIEYVVCVMVDNKWVCDEPNGNTLNTDYFKVSNWIPCEDIFALPWGSQ